MTYRERLSLGSLLHHVRTSHEMTLRHVAERAEVDHAYISRLESGEKSEPTLGTLLAIARALRMCDGEVELLLFLRGHPGAKNSDDMRRAADQMDVMLGLRDVRDPTRVRRQGES